MKPLNGVTGTCARFQWTFGHQDLLSTLGVGYHLPSQGIFPLEKTNSWQSGCCFKCKQQGHFRRKCPWRWPEESSSVLKLASHCRIEIQKIVMSPDNENKFVHGNKLDILLFNTFTSSFSCDVDYFCYLKKILFNFLSIYFYFSVEFNCSSTC